MVAINLLVICFLLKRSDAALIDAGISIMFPDLFCTRPPPWPLFLVRPEFKVYTRSKNKSFTLPILDEAVKFVNELNDENYFELNRQVVFIVHGFLGNNKCTPWLNTMKDAILKEEDSTIIIVDWRYGADIPEFGTAASNTETTSTAIATVAGAILDSTTFNGDTSRFYLYCIGHSLGAHTCGQAGRKSKSRHNNKNESIFDRITALDPAGPGFEKCPSDKQIDKDAALCVDVIHTDGSLKGHLFSALHFGTLKRWGNIDFYPNGGRDQPGCTPFFNDCGCSHKKAPDYFLATIGNRDICEAIGFCSDVNRLPESCSNETRQLMGYYSPCHYESTMIVEGAFYLNVKAESPFCID